MGGKLRTKQSRTIVLLPEVLGMCKVIGFRAPEYSSVPPESAKAEKWPGADAA